MGETMSEMPSPANVLKNSPVANMALASKELFHSNFLAWVFGQYPSTLNALLKNTDVPGVSEDAKLEIGREEHNFDLIIRIDDDRLLIIENKLKSLPDASQLQRYTEKATQLGKDKRRTDRILLTLTHNDWSRLPSRPDGWHCADYDKLGCSLPPLIPTDAKPYYDAIIRDYALFIRTLAQIAADESGDIWNRAGSQIDGEESRSWLTAHKLNDLFGKRQGQYVALQVYEALSHRLKSRIVWQQNSTKNLDAGQVNVYSNFSNSQPSVGVHFALSKTLCPDGATPVGVGFQVQGSQFRSFLEWPKPGPISNKTHEIARRIFSDSDCPTTFWTPGQGSAGRLDQCKFGVHFHYRYTRLEDPEKTHLDELADKLAQDALRLLDDLPKIERVFSNHLES